MYLSIAGTVRKTIICITRLSDAIVLTLFNGHLFNTVYVACNVDRSDLGQQIYTYHSLTDVMLRNIFLAICYHEIQ